MVLTYGHNIRRLRIECGLSQAELARRVGVVRQVLWGWERQLSEPGLTHLVKLAGALEVAVDDLLRPPEPHSPG